MQVEVTSSYLELGLVFIGSVTVAVLTVLLCTCFKKRGASIADDHKNGHILVTTRLSGVLDPEFEDEGLKGAKATSHRRLPDIPDSVPNGSDNPDARQSSVRSSQDTSSELYAQVEIGPTANSFPVNSKKGKEAEASRPGPSFTTEPEETPETHPYDKVKSNHGYSKIKKKAENPYAKVKRSDTMESENAEGDENETDTDNYDVVYTLHTVDETKKTDLSPHAATASPESSSLLPPPLPFPLRGSHSSLVSGDSAPRPPPRGRRGNSVVLSHASSGSNILRPNSLVISDQESVVADAVDGAVAAEDELPVEVHGAGAAQIHFSGDSQASQDSKGYSSISVREPLANLKAQNPTMAVGRQRIGSSNNTNRQTESVDSHYATVSDPDDSDEMYAAIAELPSVYDNATGSDTYARITERAEAQPLGVVNAPANGAVSVATSPPPSLQSETELSPSSPLPPAPPSVVLLKQLSSGSSRLHASTLSIASQTSGVGSPKPEKRQANSPLPPTPVSQEAADGSRRSMNVEEMYAKVMKKKALHSWQSADSASGKAQQHRGSVDLGFLASRDTDSFINDASRRNSADFSSHRTIADPVESVLVIEPSIQENCVTGVEEEDDDEDEDLRYEVLPAARNDRQASESDPGYERIQLKSGDSFSEPRYERIQPKREGEVEPNYEVVGFQGTLEGETSEHGYETVELSAQAFDRQDPNYESLHYSVHSIAPDPPYASIMARDVDIEGGPSEAGETFAEPVVNNNTVDVPVYAQVVKSKRTTVQSTSPAPDSVLSQAEVEVGAFQPKMTVQTQDYSVSSSKNTTIIRITDNSPSFRFFADQDSFGVPEQV